MVESLLKRTTLTFSFLLAFLSAGFSIDIPARPTSYLLDEANVIDPETQQRIRGLLNELEQKTSIEMAVVTVTSLRDQPVDFFANTLFVQWGIGKKDKNNGVLLLIAPNDRQMRIEVGYGLEDQLPDGLVGRIRDQAILPFFKSGQISEGIWQGTVDIAFRLATKAGVQLSSPNLQPRSYPERRKATLLEKMVQFLFLIILGFIVIKNPWLLLLFLRGGSRHGSSWSGGGFGGGGFGGFGGGMSGGGGASGRW